MISSDHDVGLELSALAIISFYIMLCCTDTAASDVMSWNELYWRSRNDTDLRSVGSTGSRQSAEMGYPHLVDRNQEIERQHTSRGADGRLSDVSRV